MSLINVEKTIVLDVYDHDTTPSVIKAVQMDEGTRTVFAVIQNSGQDYDIGQNASLSLTVLRPDKTKVQITGEPYPAAETTIDGETITYYGASAELTQLALAVKGTLKGQFKITSGDQELRTEIFTINNGEALDAGDGDWAGDLDGHNLDEMAQDIEDAKAAVSEMESDVSDLKSGFDDLYNTAYVTDSASGSIAHFVDGADSVPMKSVKVNIEPVQSGSGDPSPDNVRPITGWNSVKVTRTGKNLLDFESLLKKWGANYTKTDDAFIVTTLGQGYYQPYVFAQKDVNISVSAVIINGEGAVLWRLDFLNANDVLVASLNADRPAVANVMASKIRLNYSTGGNGGTYKNVQVELGSVVTDYKPYNGTTYDVSLASAGTVYGGTLDAVSGELVIDRRLIDLVASGYTFNLKDAAIYPNNYVYTNYTIGNMLEKNNSGDITKIVCNYLPPRARNTTGIGVFQVHDGNANEVRLSFPKEDRFATWASVQEWMRSLADPFVLCIPLAESLKTTYTLTHTEIKSLLGINNVWSDAGDVDVEYRADTKLYIDKRLAEVTA